VSQSSRERADVLIVYGARDCSLCDQAMAVLGELAPGLGLTLRYVRIDGQPELEGLYREQIPVGFLDGRKVFKYHVDPERLRRAVTHRSRTPPVLLDTLKALETSLHDPEVRRSAERLGALLHPAFRELGRSGREYTREEVLAEFSGGAPEFVIWAQDFSLEVLSESLALLTYRSAHVADGGALERHTLRASLWQRTEEGWKMRFHQGTPTAAFEKRED
jgi:hypothetical protein